MADAAFHREGSGIVPLAHTIDFGARTWSPGRSINGGGLVTMYPAQPSAFQLCQIDAQLMSKDTPAAVRQELLETNTIAVRSEFHLDPHPQFDHHGRPTLLIDVGRHREPFDKLDAANVGALLANPELFFGAGRRPRSDLIRSMYNPLVQLFPKSPKIPTAEKTRVVRAKMHDKGMPGATMIYVQHPHDYGRFRRGTIQDVKRGSRVVPIFEDLGMYAFVTGRSGGRLHLKQVLVLHTDPPPPAEPMFGFGGPAIVIDEAPEAPVDDKVYTEVLCVACLDTEPGPVFPCGHQCVCACCAAALPKKMCPMCRAPFE